MLLLCVHATHSWERGCSREIFGAACVYCKGTPSSALRHTDISGGDHNGLGIDNANLSVVEVAYNRIHDNGREDGYGEWWPCPFLRTSLVANCRLG